MENKVFVVLDCDKEINFNSLLLGDNDTELVLSDSVSKNILVINWDHKENDTIERIKKHNIFGSNVKLIYLQNYLAQENILSPNKKKCAPELMEEMVAIPDKKRKNVYRCYKDGVYTIFKICDDHGNNSIVDYLRTDFSRSKREYYDSFGYVRTIDYMGKENTPIRRVYLNDSGRCYLSCRFSSSGEINEYIYFDVNNKKKYQVFSSYEDLIASWVNEILDEDQSNLNKYLYTNYTFKNNQEIHLDPERIILLA